MSRVISNKIKSISELAKILQESRKKSRKIVLCHGVFDLLHPGHIRYFEAAKQKGDILVVTVTKDEFVNKGPGRPIFNQFLRAESVAAIECVDYVAVNEWPTAVETIKKLRPNFYAKGSDYADKKEDVTGNIYAEEKAVKSVGASMYFTEEITFSSTSIINTFLAPYSDEAKDFFGHFKRHYTAKDIINALRSVSDVKVLLIGDIIIDEYHYCKGIGKSQKDNIIATKFLEEEIFAGGVLAAANHLAGFCRHVSLVSAIGTKNDYRRFIATHLKPNIRTNFYYQKDVPTVVKRRYIDPDFLNKLFEICYLEDTRYLSEALEKKICAYLESHIKNFDLVVAADFGHGLMTPRIIEVLCKKSKFLAVNTQTNSANIGFNLITKFARADYICIDEPEIRLACHDKFSRLENLVLKVGKQLHCDKIIVTRGHLGSLAYSHAKGFTQIPVFSKQVVDRIGAGDAFFSVTSPCAEKGNPMEAVAFIGNAVGAMKVLIVGNRSAVEPVPLFKYIATLLK